MRSLLPTLLLAVGCQAEPERSPLATDDAAASATTKPAEQPSATPMDAAAHPCLVQDGKRLDVSPIRAVGTEPFWGARTQARCVTYSTPEDQAGTRVWAKLESGPNGTVWNGALRGKRFRLSIQPMAGCSDGMSDTRYPLEAKLLVDGEERRGCAEPLATGR